MAISSRRCGATWPPQTNYGDLPRRSSPPYSVLLLSLALMLVFVSWVSPSALPANGTFQLCILRRHPVRVCSMRRVQSRMAVIPCNWAMLIANLLVPVAILVFSTGFFPYKPLLPGLATFEEANGDNRPPAVFDKVVFMVVDALRRYSCFCVRNICI